MSEIGGSGPEAESFSTGALKVGGEIVGGVVGAVQDAVADVTKVATNVVKEEYLVDSTPVQSKQSQKKPEVQVVKPVEQPAVVVSPEPQLETKLVSNDSVPVSSTAPIINSDK